MLTYPLTKADKPMPPPRFEWTPELSQALRDLRIAGLSLDNCAEQLNISSKVVKRRAREMGIHYRKPAKRQPKIPILPTLPPLIIDESPYGNKVIWTAEMLRSFHALRSQGYPIMECAEKIGIGYNLALRKAQEMGWNCRFSTGLTPGIFRVRYAKSSAQPT